MVSLANSLDFKYQYKLAFYACTGKLLYLFLYNFYVQITSSYNFHPKTFCRKTRAKDKKELKSMR